MLLHMVLYHSLSLTICTISSLSIHLSVDTLCCFYVLTIVNSGAMNTGVCISFQIRVFSGYTPRVGLLDSMATLFLFF